MLELQTPGTMMLFANTKNQLTKQKTVKMY